MSVIERDYMKHWPTECPKGWRVLAYRPVEPGDFYLSQKGIVYESDAESLCSWPIVEPAIEYTAPKFDSNGQPLTQGCQRCDEVGDVDCPNCDGSGENKYGLECVWCSGSGDVCCPDCEGKGMVSDGIATKQLEYCVEALRCENWELTARLSASKSENWELRYKLGIVEALEEKTNG